MASPPESHSTKKIVSIKSTKDVTDTKDATIGNGGKDSAHYICGHDDIVLDNYLSRNAGNCCAYLLPHLDRLAAQNKFFRILDVGCGPGSITIDLARRYPHSTVMGVDHPDSQHALERGRAAAAALGLHHVVFEVADVHRLTEKIDPRTFDAVHAHQVLQHCGDPVHALQQMRAVTCAGPYAGGLVAARTADFSGLSTYPPGHYGMREWVRLWRLVAPLHGGDMDAGASQHAWARAAGFDIGPESKSVLAMGAQCWNKQEERAAFAQHIARVMDGTWKESALKAGLATEEELERIKQSLREWGEMEDGMGALLNGEMVLYV